MRRCSCDRPVIGSDGPVSSRRDILKKTAAGTAGFVLFSAKTGTASATGDDSGENKPEIHHDVVVDWDSENKDRVSLEATFEFNEVDQINLWVQEGVTIENSGNFEKSDGTYWTDISGSTIRASAPTPSGSDEYVQTPFDVFDGEDWAFVAAERLVRASIGSADYTVNITIPDSTEGVVGGHHALLGSYERYSDESTHGTMNVIIPDAADPASDGAEILDALVRTSDRLDIGGTDAKVSNFAIPQEVGRGGGADGSHTSAWTRADFAIDRVQSVWDHEYVHTRQEFVGITTNILTDETRWIFEGQPDHYGILLPFEDGRVTFSDMQGAYRRGLQERHQDVVLNEQESWIEENRANYELGALVLGRLDLEIRRATDGDSTLDAVFRKINDLPTDTEFTHDQFLDFIEETSTAEVADKADEYVSTTRRPELWDRETHERYFPSRVQEESTDAESEPDPEESEASENGDTSDGATDDTEPTESTPDTESAADTDDDTPGFGITSSVLALSTLGYLLKERVIGETQESE